MHRLTRSLPPLPVIGSARWEWPRAPFACSLPPSLGAGAAEPCLVEAVGGSRSEAQLTEMNPECGFFQMRAAGGAQTVSFSKIRRLTLTTPLTMVNPIGSPQSGSIGPGGAEHRE